MKMIVSSVILALFGWLLVAGQANAETVKPSTPNSLADSDGDGTLDATDPTPFVAEVAWISWDIGAMQVGWKLTATKEEKKGAGKFLVVEAAIQNFSQRKGVATTPRMAGTASQPQQLPHPFLRDAADLASGFTPGFEGNEQRDAAHAVLAGERGFFIDVDADHQRLAAQFAR